MQPPTTSPDPEVHKALSFLETVLASYRPRNFTVRFWDGTILPPDPGTPSRFTLVLRHPGSLRRMFMRTNQVTLGEAFVHDHFDVEGDLVEAFALGDYLLGLQWNLLEKARFGKYLLSLPRLDGGTGESVRLTGTAHSRKRDSQAVRSHYDKSNDFYRLWLDERMVYSCAYFHEAEELLDAAQERKLDYICRKLRLRRGERLLDIGCGWGGLVAHAARNYGVKAHGITLSPAQAELGCERIAAAGLADRCRIEIRDYRDLDQPESFDKIASVGMFEHVGKKQLETYFAQAFRLLKPGGAFLNHGITTGLGYVDDRNSFIDRYVFPDGDLQPVTTTLQAAETNGFEVRDVESLREHYALTLRHWVQRLEERLEAAAAATDRTTCRIWRLYMAGSAHGFQCGRLNVYQALMVKPERGRSGQPLTRRDWYT